ncbi:uroporphyrinogen decarboxylase family protein [Termitidicoccus mucosus]|uniref:Uroporphyrinogen decarboxylase (URO-D) domain-containing protein n=2 Tax=Termitidicoccus mucosus TaxID=1184151 RepID=A0A178ICU6_9BACT|nr:hypothetical protein AW736_22590 [Opitutaceae bacterium TSB47]
MTRALLLDLARQNHRVPIGTHLVLHRHADHEAIIHDGARLGATVAEAAARFSTPLAMPLMDLTLEKAALLLACGIPASQADSHHFTEPPAAPASIPLTPRMTATCGAITHIAETHPALVPMGMGIGPFSLMTKLVTDPIMPVFLAGNGLAAEDDPEVALVERLLALGEQVIHRYLTAQIDAGAKALVICEPAANLVYFSPKQQEETGYDVFERYVMEPMRRIAALLRARGVDLIFHDCGELTDEMVNRFATLGASMISLGCSRALWKDAALVPKDTVLYGNLPSKQFYATQLSAEAVAQMACELVEKMSAAGHPFILGSECDVLSVPGSEAEIMRKVDAFMQCPVTS